LHNVEVPLGQRFRDEVGGVDVDGPPLHVNCILPGNVVAVPGLVAGSKSFYVGRCIEVRTANGRGLTVTQNHPILTSRGWVLAKLINEGDQIVVCTNPKRVVSSIYPDYEHMPTVIEEVFSALKMSRSVLTGRVPVTAEDFYVDGRFIHGDIEVVGPDSFLLGDIQARLAQLKGQLSFNGGSAALGALVGTGAFSFLFNSDNASPGDSVGGSDLASSLPWRHLLPFDEFGLGLSAGSDPGAQKPLSESRAIDARLAREFVLRFASDIALEQVIEVRNFDFSGHVYDLQSGLYELYTCNGIVVKNCRCWVTGVVREGERPEGEEVPPSERPVPEAEAELQAEMAEVQEFVNAQIAAGDETGGGMRGYLDNLRDSLREERAINAALWKRFGLTPDQATDGDWLVVADDLQREGYDLYKKYTKEGIQLYVSEARGARESGYMIVGKEQILVRQGAFSVREAQRMEGRMWAEAKDELDQAMGQFLRRAGYSTQDIARADYYQRLRLLEEMGSKELMRTGTGRPSRIDEVPVESRMAIVGAIDYDLAATCANVSIDPLYLPTLDAYGKMELADIIRQTKIAREAEGGYAPLSF